jgi:hypothetical protein
MTDVEFNDLVVRLKDYFQPKTEIAHKLPNIKEVDDMTEITYTDNSKKVIAKAINGNWIETYREV